MSCCLRDVSGGRRCLEGVYGDIGSDLPAMVMVIVFVLQVLAVAGIL